MHHIVYKTIHIESGQFYIGVHSTNNLDDGYLGSGTEIMNAIKKYGAGAFRREIIKECRSREEALEEERLIVDASNPLSYNLVDGGGAPPIMRGTAHPLFGSKRPDCKERMTNNNPSRLPHVRKFLKDSQVGIDAEGNKIRCLKDDPRWLTGELVPLNRGKITAKDKDGNCFHVSKDDPRWLTGELRHVTAGLKLTCPHCGKQGGNTMRRWHFDNCKRKS